MEKPEPSNYYLVFTPAQFLSKTLTENYIILSYYFFSGTIICIIISYPLSWTQQVCIPMQIRKHDDWGNK